MCIQQNCRDRLIQAATELFVEDGYRVTLDRVAARAAVARQTLYNYFSTKESLFAEVVRLATADMLLALDSNQSSLTERLISFGITYRDKLLSPQGIGFFRALAAEAVRFPDLTASVYRNGPKQTEERVATVLNEAMMRGELRIVSPDFAAQMLLAMLISEDRTYCLMTRADRPAKDTVQVAQVIDCFLRAFAPVT